jgi:hypothetical protein
MKISPLIFVATTVLVPQVAAFFAVLGCAVASIGVAGGCHATVMTATGGIGAGGCHALAMGTWGKCAPAAALLPW